MTATIVKGGPMPLSPPQSKGIDEHWQRILAESYKTPQTLLHDLELGELDYAAHQLFSVRVPKPFAEKMQKANRNDPLLLQVLPQASEFQTPRGFSQDPLEEQQYNVLPGLLHKYPSRVLLTLSGACAVNCRYCFRRHFDYAENRVKQSQLNAILDYIAKDPNINEVILSGGDPLMMLDKQFKVIVDALSLLPQLKRLRIHTRLPVMIPERITDTLINLLTSTPLKTVMVLHCNHPNELDNNFSYHLQKLNHRGITLLNQSVLLKGVNDDADTLAALSERLFEDNILPYYLFLLDRVSGTAHFEVSEKTAKQLIRATAAKLPGYLVPKLTRECPGLSSKNMWI